MMYSEAGEMARYALRMTKKGVIDEDDWKTFIRYIGYTDAVKPPVRRTGNRKSGPEGTGIYAAEPPSRR